LFEKYCGILGKNTLAVLEKKMFEVEICTTGNNCSFGVNFINIFAGFLRRYVGTKNYKAARSTFV